MEIPKEQILQMLRDRGDHDVLGKIGIDPSEMLGGAGGKFGL